MASLVEKTTRLTEALGIEMHADPCVPLPAAVAQAVAVLGLQSDTKGMNLVQQVDACMTVVFGAPGPAAGGMAHAAAAVPVTMAMASAPPMTAAATVTVMPMTIAYASVVVAAAVPVDACAGMVPLGGMAGLSVATVRTCLLCSPIVLSLSLGLWLWRAHSLPYSRPYSLGPTLPPSLPPALPPAATRHSMSPLPRSQLAFVFLALPPDKGGRSSEAGGGGSPGDRASAPYRPVVHANVMTHGNSFKSDRIAFS